MLILEVTMTKTRAGGCFRAPTNAGNYSALPRYKADSRSVGKLPPRRRTAALWTPLPLLTIPTNRKKETPPAIAAPFITQVFKKAKGPH